MYNEVNNIADYNMSCINKKILVGQIISLHGINGAVKIRSYTEFIENIFLYKLFLEDNASLELKHLFTKLPNIICKIDNINNINEAEKFIGLKIFTDRDSLSEINNEDEFYLEDLINLPILDKNNNEIGKINNILNYGAGDLVEVEFIDGKSEILQFTKKNFPLISEKYVILDLTPKDE
jgi:16S rRNA processing protein RimM